MDRFRAIRYFVEAARQLSLSAAAREHDVSVQAVSKLITALERDLGAKLFERTSQGLTLTGSGAAYLDGCKATLEAMAEADDRIRSTPGKAHGTLVVGVQIVIARGFLAKVLPRFHSRYPDIQIDLRPFDRGTDDQVSGVDVFLVMGWPRSAEFVQRRIGSSRFYVAATPGYWAAHGMPKHPEDLRHHNCVLLRSVDGTVMDLWEFTRGDEKASVVATGWLAASNAHRDTLMSILMAGEGVARMLDWTVHSELATGALVRALPDWESTEAPPVNLLYRSALRRAAPVRLFIDFVTEQFAMQEPGRAPGGTAEEPRWLQKRYRRASAILTHDDRS